MCAGQPAGKTAPSEEGSKPRSISRRLTVSLVLTIIVVATTTMAFIYRHASHKEEQELNAKADEYLAYLIGILEVPLWNVDERTVHVIVNTVFQNELVMRLIIKNPKGNVIDKFLKKENGSQQINRSGKIKRSDKHTPV